jgi:hypothetical protein
VSKYQYSPKLGDIWQDCDKRMGHRRCRVVAINGSKAQLQNVAGPVPATWVSLRRAKWVSISRTTWVSIRRMYPHSTGWRLVERSREVTP